MNAWYSMLSDAANFSSTSSSRSILICQNNTAWKVDEIVSESEIILREAARSTEWKTWHPGRPREIYQNRETHSGTGRVGKSIIVKRLVRFDGKNMGRKIHRQKIDSSQDIYPKEGFKWMQPHR